MLGDGPGLGDSCEVPPCPGDHEREVLDTLDADDGLVLPPPAVALGLREADERGFGPLPLELWRRVTLCLDPFTLCRARTLAPGCRLPHGVEGELWARLCALHFPAMYASVLADLERGRDPKDLSSPTLNPDAAKSRHGRHRRGSGCGAPPAPRTPWWRRAKDGAGASAEPSQEPAPGLPSSPWLGPLSSGSSTCLSPSCSPLPSPALTPSQWPASPAFMPVMALDLRPSLPDSDLISTAASSPCATAADWAALYARRWQKKVLWEGAKKSVTRDRTVSGATDGSSTSAGGGSSECGAEPKRVSELTQRELGRLCDASCRLKVCTLCGEKFSPGQARKEPTGCCFHPGDFTPANSEGWSRAELKQMKQHARQALRSAGGASWVKRHPRASHGHGHWLKGLGVSSCHKDKFRRCLEGDIPARWACCDARELFAEGCQRGMHRHF